jgi:hypothetical protein
MNSKRYEFALNTIYHAYSLEPSEALRLQELEFKTLEIPDIVDASDDDLPMLTSYFDESILEPESDAPLAFPETHPCIKCSLIERTKQNIVAASAAAIDEALVSELTLTLESFACFLKRASDHIPEFHLPLIEPEDLIEWKDLIIPSVEIREAAGIKDGINGTSKRLADIQQYSSKFYSSVSTTM